MLCIPRGTLSSRKLPRDPRMGYSLGESILGVLTLI